jgi:hypothetical protein
MSLSDRKSLIGNWKLKSLHFELADTATSPMRSAQTRRVI